MAVGQRLSNRVGYTFAMMNDEIRMTNGGLGTLKGWGILLFTVRARAVVRFCFRASAWESISVKLGQALSDLRILKKYPLRQGYGATGGAQGVGQATTRAVVHTSVLVLAVDYILTALLF